MYTEYAEAKWVNGRCTLFKNFDYDALHFHTGSLKTHIFQVLFWEGVVTKKEYSVYVFENVDNSGRILRYQPLVLRCHTADRRCGDRAGRMTRELYLASTRRQCRNPPTHTSSQHQYQHRPSDHIANKLVKFNLTLERVCRNE